MIIIMKLEATVMTVVMLLRAYMVEQTLGVAGREQEVRIKIVLSLTPCAILLQNAYF